MSITVVADGVISVVKCSQSKGVFLTRPMAFPIFSVEDNLDSLENPIPCGIEPSGRVDDCGFPHAILKQRATLIPNFTSLRGTVRLDPVLGATTISILHNDAVNMSGTPLVGNPIIS